ncbi:hypothetical protein MSUIS_05840 [Mycoplasma suis KI3806]|uniref:Uncharacterized protein n=1 Tax=Mycoplasma suis (strain KI_3806) TaxID=708248 RepID=F0V1Z6_MYCS3|nr:hypothetical protein [Mycoplasma suis]CBZ40677.1 hypothetical protein MSUIS_05840 [Mycoplasma suis KI3806]
MNYLSLGSILLGTTAGFSGVGYLASTFFNKGESAEGEITVVKSEEKGGEINVWEYVLMYQDGMGGEMCDFLEEGQDKSYKEKNLNNFEAEPINCQTTWAKQVIKENSGKKTLWIKGKKDPINKLLSDTESSINKFSFYGSLEQMNEGKIKNLEQLKNLGCQVSQTESEIFEIKCQDF